MKRCRIVSCIGLVLFAALLSVTPALAQDYPKGTIQLVIPFGPGGATDIFWRTLGDHFSKLIGAPLAMVNKTGGGGIVGMSSVINNAKPDGYTLCAGNSDTLNITPLFTQGLPFDTINDVNYMVKVANFPQSLVVRADSPFKSLDDVIAYARANPKKLKASTPGKGTNPYMALQLLNYEAKADMVPVNFSGAGENMTAVLGGHVDVAAIAVPPVKAQVTSGKIRMLAIFSKQRHPAFPDVPTAFEKGYRQTLVDTGMGIVGPKGLPAEVITKWEKAVQTMLKDPAVMAAISKFDFVADYQNGAQYKKEVADEYALFKKVVDLYGN